MSFFSIYNRRREQQTQLNVRSCLIFGMFHFGMQFPVIFIYHARAIEAAAFLFVGSQFRLQLASLQLMESGCITRDVKTVLQSLALLNGIVSTFAFFTLAVTFPVATRPFRACKTKGKVEESSPEERSIGCSL